MATPQLARRLQKEIGSMRSAPAGITGGPVGDDLLNWRCSIDGPDDSPFKSGKFPVAIKFPDDYPFKPPVVKFAVKVYHPNVDDDGSICVGLLKTDTWKPVTSVLEILQELVNLLREPNPNDPLVSSIAELYIEDRKKFEATAKDWTKRFASGK